MDGLPVELVRLIYGHCDPASVKTLRLVNQIYADVGYDFLLGHTYTSVGWGNGVDSLHGIAHHDRLKPYIERVTLNFSEVDEYHVRNTKSFRHFTEDRKELSEQVRNAQHRYNTIYNSSHQVNDLVAQHLRLNEALRELPNLERVEVTFTQSPSDNEMFKKIFEMPHCRKLDHTKAASHLNGVISALDQVRFRSLSIDWFPFELFRHPEHRKHWFRFDSSLAHLERLDLVVDPALTADTPRTQLIALNGLGRILSVCKSLTNLSLAFRNSQRPRAKTIVWFQDFLGPDFRFPCLTDLKLEGMNCGEGDLTEFLVRHTLTLRRLRLGGRGLARFEEQSIGGMALCRGQWRNLFAALRKGLDLERLHLEGEFTSLPRKSPRHEAYLFHPTTDDNWNDIDSEWKLQAASIDGAEFERYIVDGGAYPGSP